MANHIWVGGTSDDMTNDANWTSVKPANNGTVIFDGSPTNSPTTGLTAMNAITGTTIHVGPNWTGQSGTSSNAVQIGTGTTLYFNAPLSTLNHFDIETCDNLQINNTHGTPGAFTFSAGTVTLAVIKNGGGVKFDGGTLTAAELVGPASVLVTANTTLTAFRQTAGFATLKISPVTLEISGAGVCDHWAASGTITTVNGWGGRLIARTPNSIYTTVNSRGTFIIDGMQAGDIRTITTLNGFSGQTSLMSAWVVTTHNKYGAEYDGPKGATVNDFDS